MCIVARPYASNMVQEKHGNMVVAEYIKHNSIMSFKFYTRILGLVVKKNKYKYRLFSTEGATATYLLVQKCGV